MAGCFQSKIIYAGVIFLILLAGCKQSIRTSDKPYILTDREKSLLQNGDIILRKGEGILSNFICDYLADTINISHCGILIKNRQGLQVIHTLSADVSDTDGVQSCSIDMFTAESVKGSIIAIRCISDTCNILASQALHYLKLKTPFDRHFNLMDSTAFFCSELPLHILKYSLHIDLTTAYPPLFSSFLNQQYFEIILPVKWRSQQH